MSLLPARLRRRAARLWRVVRWHLADQVHERRLGIRTSGLSLAHANQNLGIYGYGAVPYSTLGDVHRHLLKSGGLPRLFVDLGCGLGRPLYYFADLGVSHLVGVEIDPTLHARATALLEHAKQRRSAYSDISLRLGDAVEHLPPQDEDVVIFLYNPFGERTLRRLGERLRSRRAHMRIYYANPQHGDVLTQALGVSPPHVIPSFVPFAVYELNAPASRCSAPPKAASTEPR